MGARFDEALATLTRRYFRSHAPATLQDFVWWSGLNTADARRGVELGEGDLEKGLMGEKVYWSLRSGEGSGRSLRTAHLLPAYDEYFVAYRDRAAITTRLEGLDMFANHLAVDGCLAGSWRVRDGRVSITSHLPLGARDMALAEREQRRYHGFAAG